MSSWMGHRGAVLLADDYFWWPRSDFQCSVILWILMDLKRVTRVGQARPHPCECWCCQVPVVIHLEGTERVSGFWMGVLTRTVLSPTFQAADQKPLVHKEASIKIVRLFPIGTKWKASGLLTQEVDVNQLNLTLLPKTKLILRQINTLWLWK